MRAKWAWLTVLLSLPLVAQMRMSVEQLMQFIQSSIKLNHEDRRVAEYLKKVKLSNRLDDRVIEDLQGQGAGPRTVAAMRELAAGTKDLAPPPPVVPKPTPTPIPGPSPEEQKKIIEEVRDYAKN